MEAMKGSWRKVDEPDGDCEVLQAAGLVVQRLVQGQQKIPGNH